jgi:class 3 adenylate cyclase
MFCDIRGFTREAVRHQPEDVRRFKDGTREAIERWEGVHVFYEK